MFLYHGPVRVPADAKPGKAIIRVILTKESTFKSLPTNIEIELVKEVIKPKKKPKRKRKKKSGKKAVPAQAAP